MGESSVSQVSSLRERKKARTRRVLIDTALDLCIKQGFDDTTVEQISDVAEVSTRTFNRYFATKDAVFIAVVDDLANEVVAELRLQPKELGPLEALRAAHMEVLNRVASGPLAGLTADRLVLILRIVYSSDTLRQAAIDYRSQPAMEALAHRMGVKTDDKNLQLAVSVFATTIVTACSDLLADGPDGALGPDAVMERLENALGQVAGFAADLKLPGA